VSVSAIGQGTSGGRLRPVDVLWIVFAAMMLTIMVLHPADQTIPYHLLYVSFTLLYGFRLWSPRVTWSVLAVLTFVPGELFLRGYLAGRVEWSELAEIPIVGGMAWHAHRSGVARRLAEDLAAREASQGERQREFLRDTAHAIRTPITIGRGHVELIQSQELDQQVREDSGEVLHQFDRLDALARRLLMIEALRTEPAPGTRVDVATLTADLGRRWSRSVSRSWVVDVSAEGAGALTDPARLEEALDALVENALRFTEPGDTVRVSCRTTGPWVTLEVADSGPGIPADDIVRVFERFYHRHPPGMEPGNGLGLALVAAVVAASGGTAVAGSAAEGGALITLRLPRA